MIKLVNRSRLAVAFLVVGFLVVGFLGGVGFASAAESVPNGPALGLNFTEVPSTIEELRFAFQCKDDIEIEIRWVAQDVGDAAPANFQIATIRLVTKGPLNVARLSRPKNGWPLGLYRLELRHQNQPFHTVHYVIEDPQVLQGTKADIAHD